jgi:hypothetical protein
MNSHNPAGSAEQFSLQSLKISPQTAQWLIGCYLYYAYQFSQPDNVNNITKNTLTPFALAISTGIMCYTNADTISSTACTLFHKGVKLAKEVMEKKNNATVEPTAPKCKQ